MVGGNRIVFAAKHVLLAWSCSSCCFRSTGYFARFDVLVDILVAHDLVPVLQPVF